MTFSEDVWGRANYLGVRRVEVGILYPPFFCWCFWYNSFWIVVSLNSLVFAINTRLVNSMLLCVKGWCSRIVDLGENIWVAPYSEICLISKYISSFQGLTVFIYIEDWERSSWVVWVGRHTRDHKGVWTRRNQIETSNQKKWKHSRHLIGKAETAWVEAKVGQERAFLEQDTIYELFGERI